VPAPEVNVTEADVDKFLDAAREERATWAAADRPAAMGDHVLVDIRGAVGDDQILNNQDWELTLREEGGWLPGFDQAFVGLKAGDVKSFSLTYPEDSTSRYKGQTADFETTIKEVRGRVTPEVTDELVKELGEYADVTDFRAKKLAELQEQGVQRAEAELTDAGMQAIVDQAVFAYPPAAVDDVVRDMLRDLQVRVSGAGYSLEDFLRLQGTNLERYREQIRPAAERRLKGQLVLTELAVLEQINVSEEESQAELQRMVSEASSEEQAQMFREVFGSEQGLHLLYHDLLNQKTVARLRAVVTGTAPDLPAGEPAAESEAPATSETVAAPVEEAASQPPQDVETPAAE
jgi:trigger factor